MFLCSPMEKCFMYLKLLAEKGTFLIPVLFRQLLSLHGTFKKSFLKWLKALNHITKKYRWLTYVGGCLQIKLFLKV